MCIECGCGDERPFGVEALQPGPGQPVRLAPIDASGHWHRHEDGTWHAHDHEPGHSHHQHHQEHGAGAAEPSARVLEVAQPILVRNLRLAERNRGFLRARGLYTLNVLSSPGAGKTTLLERTAAALAATCPVAVVVGDLATARDGERIRAAGAPVVQITTGTVCHLDAEMVARGLERLDLEGRRLLFLENVGNLVCPADFDLGEDTRVVLLSVTEGEDKPLKYPPIFRTAGVVVLTKLDLATACGVDLEAMRANVRRMAPGAVVFELAARTGEGMEAWLDWLRARVAKPTAGSGA